MSDNITMDITDDTPVVQTPVDNEVNVLACCTPCKLVPNEVVVVATDAPPVATANAPPTANGINNLRGAHIKFYSPQLKSFHFSQSNE